MSPLYTEGDTMRAAAMMAELGVGCLITLGGDGTNRAVAAATSQIPLVAISTGTNNIFPVMVEGTLARHCRRPGGVGTPGLVRCYGGQQDPANPGERRIPGPGAG